MLAADEALDEPLNLLLMRETAELARRSKSSEVKIDLALVEEIDFRWGQWAALVAARIGRSYGVTKLHAPRDIENPKGALRYVVEHLLEVVDEKVILWDEFLENSHAQKLLDGEEMTLDLENREAYFEEQIHGYVPRLKAIRTALNACMDWDLGEKINKWLVPSVNELCDEIERDARIHQEQQAVLKALGIS